jgi:hypothetical protein
MSAGHVFFYFVTTISAAKPRETNRLAWLHC